MSKATNAALQYIEELAHDANNLLAATSDVANDRVTEARERLSDALDNGRDVYKKLRKQAIKGAQRADEVVRDNPYAPIGLALVIGGLLVFLFTRRRG